MIKLCAIIILLLSMTMSVHAQDDAKLINLFKGAPYNDSNMGKRKLVDDPHLLLMQVALKPGQAVPEHNADSYVKIIVMDGDLLITLAGKSFTATKGDLVPIKHKTLMKVSNKSKSNATFIIVKAPHPNQMNK